MQIRESAENYLEQILILNNEKGRVRSIDIAEEMGFSKPSISVAMKQFRENGFIVIDDCGNITLTESGQKIAEHTYARHQLLTDYLLSIGVSRETAIEDACRIEHYISDETFNRMKAHYEGTHTKTDPAKAKE